MSIRPRIIEEPTQAAAASIHPSLAAQMVCCVCGARLPVLENRQAYLDKHCACIMPDGSMRYYCPGTRHSAQEIDEAIHGLPAFTTGSILKKRQKLI